MSYFSNAIGSDKRNEKRMQTQAADPYNPSNAFGGAMLDSGKYAGEDRSSLLSLLSGGQDALNHYATAAVSAAMPAFQQNLQGVRESAQRRGISTGDLGTSYEGDLASAFQKNLTDSIAGQSMNLYGTQLGTTANLYGNDEGNYLDLISGALDRKQANKNAKQDRQSGLYGSLLGAVGKGVGAYFGAA